MNLPFSMPDEFAAGWFKAGLNLWTGMPAADAHGGATHNADANEWRFAASGARMFALQASARYWQKQSELWASFFSGMLGATSNAPAVVVPEHGDRRFHAEDWSSNSWYSLLKQSYLLNARMLEDLVERMLARLTGRVV